jgi:hypothetical protein
MPRRLEGRLQPALGTTTRGGEQPLALRIGRADAVHEHDEAKGRARMGTPVGGAGAVCGGVAGPSFTYCFTRTRETEKGVSLSSMHQAKGRDAHITSYPDGLHTRRISGRLPGHCQ